MNNSNKEKKEEILYQWMSDKLGITAIFPEHLSNSNGQSKSHPSKFLYKDVLNKKMKISLTVYKNCNITSAVPLVCKNATFCKYKILSV